MEKGDLVGTGRTADIFEWGPDKVLKLYKDWCKPGWIVYEEVITRICFEAGLPVPETFGLVNIDESQGLVLERVEGKTMMQMIDEQFTSDPSVFVNLAPKVAEIHASIHSFSGPILQELESTTSHVRSGIQNTSALSDELREEALASLEELPDGNVVCHYDYHPGNIIMSPRGPVLIDWLTGSRGNPHTDIARTLLLIGFRGPPPEVMPTEEFEALRSEFIEKYLSEYEKRLPLDRKELARWRIPVAAARLNENIKEMEEWLLGIVEGGSS